MSKNILRAAGVFLVLAGLMLLFVAAATWSVYAEIASWPVFVLGSELVYWTGPLGATATEDPISRVVILLILGTIIVTLLACVAPFFLLLPMLAVAMVINFAFLL